MKLIAALLLSVTAAYAGGDPGKVTKLPCDGVTTQVAEGVKVRCGPCPTKDCPEKIVLVPPPKAMGHWLTQGGVGYLTDPLLMAGHGYQWPTGWQLTGNVLYTFDDASQLDCPGPKCKTGAVTCDKNRWGGMVVIGKVW